MKLKDAMGKAKKTGHRQKVTEATITEKSLKEEDWTSVGPDAIAKANARNLKIRNERNRSSLKNRTRKSK